jgi:hypothetical protein
MMLIALSVFSAIDEAAPRIQESPSYPLFIPYDSKPIKPHNEIYFPFKNSLGLFQD